MRVIPLYTSVSDIDNQSHFLWSLVIKLKWKWYLIFTEHGHTLHGLNTNLWGRWYMASGLPEWQEDWRTGRMVWLFQSSLYSSKSFCTMLKKTYRRRHLCSWLPLKRCRSLRSLKRSIQNWVLMMEWKYTQCFT